MEVGVFGVLGGGGGWGGWGGGWWGGGLCYGLERVFFCKGGAGEGVGRGEWSVDGGAVLMVTHVHCKGCG